MVKEGYVVVVEEKVEVWKAEERNQEETVVVLCQRAW